MSDRQPTRHPLHCRHQDSQALGSGNLTRARLDNDDQLDDAPARMMFLPSSGNDLH